MKIMRILSLVLALLLLGTSLVACGEKETPNTSTEPVRDENTGKADMTAIAAEINSLLESDFTETDEVTEYVMIRVRDYGNIVLRLRADVAPITVKNFQDLVGKKFYDGLTIHRVVKNFIIQGGDPDGNGSGGSGTSIRGEFGTNGLRNELSHIRGVISMARTQAVNTASSQFFICHADAVDKLDTKYAAFGYVVAGLHVVDEIAEVKVKMMDYTPYEVSVPMSEIVIERACFVKKN